MPRIRMRLVNVRAATNAATAKALAHARTNATTARDEGRPLSKRLLQQQPIHQGKGRPVHRGQSALLKTVRPLESARLLPHAVLIARAHSARSLRGGSTDARAAVAWTQDARRRSRHRALQQRTLHHAALHAHRRLLLRWNRRWA